MSIILALNIAACLLSGCGGGGGGGAATAAKTCLYACCSNSDCSGTTPYCANPGLENASCVQCYVSTQCGKGYICGKSNTCVLSGCQYTCCSDSDCNNDAYPYCVNESTAESACVGCETADACGTGATCVNNTCICPYECCKDSQCPVVGQTCEDNICTGNQEPEATLTASVTTGDDPLTVTFDASCTDPDTGGSCTLTGLSFGDNTKIDFTSSTYKNKNTLSHSHIFPPGDYTVDLTVKDNLGATQQASATIHVNVSTPTSIAMSVEHSCLITSGGCVMCWGNNNEGQLGDGTKADRYAPVSVKGLFDPLTPSSFLAVKEVATGAAHTCVMLDNGTVKCWGQNYYGQLGNGSYTDSLTPDDVDNLFSMGPAFHIAAGTSHTCAIINPEENEDVDWDDKDIDWIECWGRNDKGQLGANTSDSTRNQPANVYRYTGDIEAVDLFAGGSHTCAIVKMKDKTTYAGLMCWGENNSGQIGNGSTSNYYTPSYVSGIGSTILTAYLGSYHTCALIDNFGNSYTKCWGQNDAGQLGNSLTSNSTTPVNVSGLSTTGISAIAAGGWHSCALTKSGRVKCWGSNINGILGTGMTGITYSTLPLDVLGLTYGVANIYAGTRSTCALMISGEIECWGFNNKGQLGDGTTTDRSTPVKVNGID